MVLAVITHVEHKPVGGNIYAAYGPYVKEMNLWFKYVDSVVIVAPEKKSAPDKIDLNYTIATSLIPVKEINLTTASGRLSALVIAPITFLNIIEACKTADHIHLRCPGNIGLLGCIAQIFFPSKKKTAKYAGNWDKNSGQPWSYRLQRWILNNEFLTRNMQVMVYGEWPDSSRNVTPFFTASYSDNFKLPVSPRDIHAQPIRLIFVGALIQNKRPLLSIEIAEELTALGIKVQLDIFGNGPLYSDLDKYINGRNLGNFVTLHGNQPADVVMEAFRQSHFLIFLSKSEGWPKVVAESMWWGCLPVTTAVSCVPQMLGNETRGSLIEANSAKAVAAIKLYMDNPNLYYEKVTTAMNWSRNYTIEKFEAAIRLLLKNE